MKGFTLIEVIIVLAIFGALAAMSVFFDLTFYRGNAFNSDYEIFVAVVQRARARAINNINESKHGIYIDADKYILYEGDNYAAAVKTEEIIRNSDINISGTSEVVFNQISGDSSYSGNIILSEGMKTATISINYEGQINW